MEHQTPEVPSMDAAAVASQPAENIAAAVVTEPLVEGETADRVEPSAPREMAEASGATESPRRECDSAPVAAAVAAAEPAALVAAAECEPAVCQPAAVETALPCDDEPEAGSQVAAEAPAGGDEQCTEDTADDDVAPLKKRARVESQGTAVHDGSEHASRVPTVELSESDAAVAISA